MKALVASLVLIAIMAMSLLLLVGHLSRVPVAESRLAAPRVITIVDSPIAASPVVEPSTVAAVLPTRASHDQTRRSASLPTGTLLPASSEPLPTQISATRARSAAVNRLPERPKRACSRS